LEVGHRVLGVPWDELSWSRWSLSEAPKPMEWARGLSFEGGQRWSRVQGFWGGRRQWLDGHGMFKIAAFLNWSFVGDGQSSMLGIHATTRELRCTWWLGRGTNGSWSQARHVECVWRMDEWFSAGFVGMSGRGDVPDAFVMVPALDARRWSRLLHHGQRMGLWCAKRHEGHGWTLQWTWSPSQQETFRCAMRWRWDA